MSGDFDDEFGDGDFAEIPDDNVMGKSDNFNLEDDDEMEFVPKSTNQRPGTAVNAAPTSKMRRTPPKNAGNQGNFASKQELSDMPFDLGTPDTSARKNFGNLANNGNQMTDRDRADDALDKLDFGNPEDDDMNLEDFIQKGGTAKDLLNKKSPAPTPASKPQPTPAKPAASNQNKPEDPFKKKPDLSNPKPATQPDKPISPPSKPAQPKPATPTPAAPIGGSTITASGLKDSLARQVGGATGEDALDKLDFGDQGNMDDNLDLALDNSGGAQPLKPSPEIKPKEPIPKTEPKGTAKDKLPSQLGNKKGEEALAELDFGGDDDFDKDFGNNNLGGGNGPGDQPFKPNNGMGNEATDPLDKMDFGGSGFEDDLEKPIDEPGGGKGKQSPTKNSDLDALKGGGDPFKNKPKLGDRNKKPADKPADKKPVPSPSGTKPAVSKPTQPQPPKGKETPKAPEKPPEKLTNLNPEGDPFKNKPKLADHHKPQPEPKPHAKPTPTITVKPPPTLKPDLNLDDFDASERPDEKLNPSLPAKKEDPDAKKRNKFLNVHDTEGNDVVESQEIDDQLADFVPPKVNLDGSQVSNRNFDEKMIDTVNSEHINSEQNIKKGTGTEKKPAMEGIGEVNEDSNKKKDNGPGNEPAIDADNFGKVKPNYKPQPSSGGGFVPKPRPPSSGIKKPTTGSVAKKKPPEPELPKKKDRLPDAALIKKKPTSGKPEISTSEILYKKGIAIEPLSKKTGLQPPDKKSAKGDNQSRDQEKTEEPKLEGAAGEAIEFNQFLNAMTKKVKQEIREIEEKAKWHPIHPPKEKTTADIERKQAEQNIAEAFQEYLNPKKKAEEEERRAAMEAAKKRLEELKKINGVGQPKMQKQATPKPIEYRDVKGSANENIRYLSNKRKEASKIDPQGPTDGNPESEVPQALPNVDQSQKADRVKQADKPPAMPNFENIDGLELDGQDIKPENEPPRQPSRPITAARPPAPAAEHPGLDTIAENESQNLPASDYRPPDFPSNVNFEDIDNINRPRRPSPGARGGRGRSPGYSGMGSPAINETAHTRTKNKVLNDYKEKQRKIQEMDDKIFVDEEMAKRVKKAKPAPRDPAIASQEDNFRLGQNEEQKLKSANLDHYDKVNKQLRYGQYGQLNGGDVHPPEFDVHGTEFDLRQGKGVVGKLETDVMVAEKRDVKTRNLELKAAKEKEARQKELQRIEHLQRIEKDREYIKRRDEEEARRKIDEHEVKKEKERQVREKREKRMKENFGVKDDPAAPTVEPPAPADEVEATNFNEEGVVGAQSSAPIHEETPEEEAKYKLKLRHAMKLKDYTNKMIQINQNTIDQLQSRDQIYNELKKHYDKQLLEQKRLKNIERRTIIDKLLDRMPLNTLFDLLSKKGPVIRVAQLARALRDTIELTSQEMKAIKECLYQGTSELLTYNQFEIVLKEEELEEAEQVAKTMQEIETDRKLQKYLIELQDFNQALEDYRTEVEGRNIDSVDAYNKIQVLKKAQKRHLAIMKELMKVVLERLEDLANQVDEMQKDQNFIREFEEMNKENAKKVKGLEFAYNGTLREFNDTDEIMKNIALFDFAEFEKLKDHENNFAAVTKAAIEKADKISFKQADNALKFIALSSKKKLSALRIQSFFRGYRDRKKALLLRINKNKNQLIARRLKRRLRKRVKNTVVADLASNLEKVKLFEAFHAIKSGGDSTLPLLNRELLPTTIRFIKSAKSTRGTSNFEEEAVKGDQMIPGTNPLHIVDDTDSVDLEALKSMHPHLYSGQADVDGKTIYHAIILQRLFRKNRGRLNPEVFWITPTTSINKCRLCRINPIRVTLPHNLLCLLCWQCFHEADTGASQIPKYKYLRVRSSGPVQIGRKVFSLRAVEIYFKISKVRDLEQIFKAWDGENKGWIMYADAEMLVERLKMLTLAEKGLFAEYLLSVADSENKIHYGRVLADLKAQNN